MVLAEKTNILTTIKTLENSCAHEMYDMSVCGECFKNSNERLDWFTTLCKVPHLLVWAKTPGHPYWPAKVIAIRNGMVDVRYFGIHQRSFIAEENIFLYSRENPNAILSKKNHENIIACYPVRSVYNIFALISTDSY